MRRLGTGAVADFLAEHAGDGRRVGVSFAGTWGRGTGDLNAVTMAAADGEAGWIDVGRARPDDDKALAGWLADPDLPKAVHDVKGPMLALGQRGWPLAGVTSDTQLAAYLVQPGQRAFDLADLALRYLKRELRDDAADDSGQLTLDGGAGGVGRRPGRGRGACGPRDPGPGRRAGRGAGRPRRHGLLTELELPLTFVLAEMEATGIAVDADVLTDLQSELGGRGEGRRERGAPGGRPPVQPRFTQATAADPVRRARAAQDQAHQDRLHHRRRRAGRAGPGQRQPAARLPARHREVTRLKSVVDSLLPMIDDHGRVHTTFNQTIAATGRLSSVDPNLQNIPVRTAEGRRIRRGVRGRRRAPTA